MFEYDVDGIEIVEVVRNKHIYQFDYTRVFKLPEQRELSHNALETRFALKDVLVLFYGYSLTSGNTCRPSNYTIRALPNNLYDLIGTPNFPVLKYFDFW